MSLVKLHVACHKQESRHTKNTCKHFQDTVFWCNLKLAQQKALQFYQTRSNAVLLYDTLPAGFFEKAICMKTKDELYQRESVVLRPRVVLKLIRKVVHKIYLYRKQDHLGNRNKMRRATGKPQATLLTTEYLVYRSTVKLQDARRQNNVTKLIEMFEKHQHKEQFFKDVWTTASWARLTRRPSPSLS